MKTRIPWLLLLLALGVAPARAASVPTFSLPRIGTVHVYRPHGPVRAVVLFASGDGGWNLGVVDMARILAREGALVAGFSTPPYLHRLDREKGRCAYPAADLEKLSQYLQRREGLHRYIPPVLAGYSSGATLTYALLAEAPAGTFRGGISLGFGPELAVTRPLCPGTKLHMTRRRDHQGYDVEPADLPVPWIILQGGIDRVYNIDAVARFIDQVGNATLVRLPHVGHGYSVRRHWVPQYRAAFAKLATRDDHAGNADNLLDLPLVEVPARSARGDTFAVMLSGDGGWVGLDRRIAADLAARGVPVAGWSSLEYFWHAHGPDEAGRDLSRAIAHFGRRWDRRHVILIGYSLGADVLPFMASRLPPGQRAQVDLVALLGPGEKTGFEFHVADWLHLPESGPRYPVPPEIRRLRGMRVLCVYGADEAHSACPQVSLAGATIREVRGGHHFGGDYHRLAGMILQAASRPARH
ncbi:MAG TPA: AcvB/VirJ family lysyl-phosphatidylglycerol hydrolase [Gammaproteobacteria bacterium]|nr:AcvB/VirJ family lysyl-phosphatidylglycerol hydrolase [Gammaproteobacteria bacterium]